MNTEQVSERIRVYQTRLVTVSWRDKVDAPTPFTCAGVQGGLGC